MLGRPIANLRHQETTKGTTVPLFIIERQFAEELDVSIEDADDINQINDEESVKWLYSFLSADRRKTYCLYEAPTAEAIRQAAVRAGLPVDVITEVERRVMPDASISEIPV